MTEFIARWKASPQDFESITPLYNQEMGYSPLESTKFDNVSPLALTQLIQNFPFFFMIILLIPFYYIVSKVASEKESKSREGMKMMGLNDATYFLAWFIFYFMICVVTSALLSLMGIAIFRNVNIFIYFLWTLCYSLTLYG
jgi:ATP-binding cassette subfamily A (ABC1) protein 3